MVTTAFINFAYFLASALIGFLPAGTGFPASVHTAAQTLGGYLYLVDPIANVSVLLTCVGIVVGAELALYGFKFLKWILHFIPWFGGKGV